MHDTPSCLAPRTWRSWHGSCRPWSRTGCQQALQGTPRTAAGERAAPHKCGRAGTAASTTGCRTRTAQLPCPMACRGSTTTCTPCRRAPWPAGSGTACAGPCQAGPWGCSQDVAREQHVGSCSPGSLLHPCLRLHWQLHPGQHTHSRAWRSCTARALTERARAVHVPEHRGRAWHGR